MVIAIYLIAIYLALKEVGKYFFQRDNTIYIPTSNVSEFQIISHLANIWYGQSYFLIL